MTRSMTGFGRSRKTTDAFDITVEIRSVNSRFLDCNTRISRCVGYLEERIKPFLQSHGVSRGKVDVSVNFERLGAETVNLTPDKAFLDGYVKALRDMRDAYGLKDDISVMTVAQNPNVFSKALPEDDVEGDWNALVPVLTDALDAFLAAREREGAALATDLLSKMDGIEEKVAKIEMLSQKDVDSYREILAARIKEALADNQIVPDEARLLTECAIHADKIAVDEELVRLRTHMKNFRKIFSGEEPVGRKLDFLLQEINREINTTGSKCSDAEIAGLVVDVKCELEKIREQVQNLE